MIFFEIFGNTYFMEYSRAISSHIEWTGLTAIAFILLETKYYLIERFNSFIIENPII